MELIQGSSFPTRRLWLGPELIEDHDVMDHIRALSSIENLPQELIDEILFYLASKDACHVLRTSRTVYRLIVPRLYKQNLASSNFLLCWACEQTLWDLANYLIVISNPEMINRSCGIVRSSAEPAKTSKVYPRIKSGVDYYGSPLHIAAYRDMPSIASKLIENGADVTLKDDHGLTALAYTRGAETIRVLLNAGADATSIDLDGYTILMRVLTIRIRRTRVSICAVENLLKTGHAAVNHFNYQQETALSFAVYHGPEMVETLLRNGADPNVSASNAEQSGSPHGIKPLATAASRRGCTETLAVLIKHGAAVNAHSAYSTPLLEAIKRESVENARFLLRAGADPEFCGWVMTEHDKELQSPLTLALSNRDWIMATLLLQSGADVNCPQPNPLSCATRLVSLEAVRFVFDNGAALIEENLYTTVIRQFVRDCVRHNSGERKSSRALSASYFPILEALAQHGANIDCPNVGIDDDPIFIAAASLNTKLIQLVIHHGGNVNAQKQTPEFRVYTPLHSAILHASRRRDAGNCAVKCLLDNGANPLIGDKLRSTPLAALILQKPDTLKYWSEDYWDREWSLACYVINHKNAGPRITARYSTKLMTIFLTRAISTIYHEQYTKCGVDNFVTPRIVEFAMLTNNSGRWGPDGITGLQILTQRPEYWRSPWLNWKLKNNQTDGLMARLTVASEVIATMCSRVEKPLRHSSYSREEGNVPGRDLDNEEALEAMSMLLYGHE